MVKKIIRSWAYTKVFFKTRHIISNGAYAVYKLKNNINVGIYIYFKFISSRDIAVYSRIMTTMALLAPLEVIWSMYG